MKTTGLKIGEEVEKVLTLKGLTKADLARLLEVKPQSIDYLMKRASVDTDTLYAISHALNHDFFALYQKLLYQTNYDKIKTERAKILVEIELDMNDVIRLNLKDRVIKTLDNTQI